MASNHPAPGRPWVSARRAAKLLRKNPRTILRMVGDGELDGGSYASPGGRVSWFVYTDRAPFTAPIPPDLADENAQLRARAMAAEESTRVLLDTQAALLEALHEYQRGNSALREALDAQQSMSDLYHRAAESYRGSADALATAVGGLRDMAAARSIPDDLSELDTLG